MSTTVVSPLGLAYVGRPLSGLASSAVGTCLAL